MTMLMGIIFFAKSLILEKIIVRQNYLFNNEITFGELTASDGSVHHSTSFRSE